MKYSIIKAIKLGGMLVEETLVEEVSILTAQAVIATEKLLAGPATKSFDVTYKLVKVS